VIFSFSFSGLFAGNNRAWMMIMITGGLLLLLYSLSDLVIFRDGQEWDRFVQQSGGGKSVQFCFYLFIIPFFSFFSTYFNSWIFKPMGAG
jgi:uncharacterized membrane protein YdjX (TVP38/TMEM64 family)